MRHPASGYVQGINDLVTPFFVVFICGYIGKIVSRCFLSQTLSINFGGLALWLCIIIPTLEIAMKFNAVND